MPSRYDRVTARTVACSLQSSVLLHDVEHPRASINEARHTEREGMRTRRIAVICCLAALTAAACSNSRQTAPSRLVSLTITGGPIAGQSAQLTASARYMDDSVRDVTTQATWQSSNQQVATVSNAGVITPVGPGDVDISASFEGQVGKLHLTMGASPVALLTLSGMPNGPVSSIQLTASAKRQNGVTEDVTSRATWQSSNAQVATVTNGLVKGVSNGTVTIRVVFEGVQAETSLVVSASATITIRGSVKEAAPNAVPVAGARVSALVGQSTVTDSSGNYVLAGVPAGSYIYEVFKDGYELLSGIGSSSVDTQENFTLFPTPPKDSSDKTATARCNDRSWTWADTQATACVSNGGIAYPVCPGPLCTN